MDNEQSFASYATSWGFSNPQEFRSKNKEFDEEDDMDVAESMGSSTPREPPSEFTKMMRERQAAKEAAPTAL